MRFLMRISWDVGAGNAVVRAGKLGQIVQSILAEQKPEAAYFTAEGGQRGGILVVNVSDVSWSLTTSNLAGIEDLKFAGRLCDVSCLREI